MVQILNDKTNQKDKIYFIIKFQIFLRLLEGGRTLEKICKPISSDWPLRFEKMTSLSFEKEIENLLNDELIKDDSFGPTVNVYSNEEGITRYHLNEHAYKHVIDYLLNTVIEKGHEDDYRVDSDDFPVTYLGIYEVETRINNEYIGHYFGEDLKDAYLERGISPVF